MILKMILAQAHPFYNSDSTKDIWQALEVKFFVLSTASKYLEFKVIMDTIIAEDQHPQAAFSKLCQHFDLLHTYFNEIPATLQLLIILAKLPWYMDMFTLLLNMSTSGVPGAPTTSLQCVSKHKPKHNDHMWKISAIKCKPADPQFQQQGDPQHKKKKTTRGQHSAQGQVKQDTHVQCHKNMHASKATTSFTFSNTTIINPAIVEAGPSIAHYDPPASPQMKNVISFTHHLEITPTIKTLSPSFLATFGLNVPSYEDAMKDDSSSLLNHLYQFIKPATLIQIDDEDAVFIHSGQAEAGEFYTNCYV
ncbi:hypothetical protein HD554DRAFT_2168647 [Boletus coccyginus]|nr:hypothetical protein HD554DRAFT_2168647 [Boletus coccyginus]